MDFYYKRDYSITQNTQIATTSPKKETYSEEDVITIASSYLEKLYQVATNNATISASFIETEGKNNKNLSSYLIDFCCDSWEFDATVEVNSSTGNLNSISITDKTKEACISRIAIKEDNFLSLKEEILSMTNILEPDKKVETITLSYNYLSDHTLNRGNVKYAVQFEDATGFVFLYSLNTG